MDVPNPSQANIRATYLALILSRVSDQPDALGRHDDRHRLVQLYSRSQLWNEDGSNAS